MDMSKLIRGWTMGLDMSLSKRNKGTYEEAGYWRKANQIHAWFVKNVQGGVDDCNEYSVDYDQLLELKALCEEVIKTKNSDLLPPQSGFFFGSTEINEDYYHYLHITIETINKLSPESRYYYSSSW